MNKYVFKPYNKDYPYLFQVEKQLIIRSLSSLAVVEHIGSTAIEGLGGKGIVDIMVGISPSCWKQSKAELVASTGYEYREKASVEERWFFRKDIMHQTQMQRIHLHLTNFNGADWKAKIAFRNYLRMHPEIAIQYVHIKQEAVAFAKGEGEKYLAYKDSFIKRILKQIT